MATASAPTGAAGVAEPAKPEAASGSTTRDVKAPDDKSPQVRTAETRQPDADTAVPDAPGTKVPTDGTGTAPAAGDARSAEAAGVAANAPAGDGKPAGDEAGAQERNLTEAKAGDGRRRRRTGGRERNGGPEVTTPRPETLAKLTPVLTKRWLSPDAWQHRHVRAARRLRRAAQGARRPTRTT